MATEVKEEAPAQAPEWIARLFPHTDEPDEFAHRLKRVECQELPVGEGLGGQVTCEFIHRNIEGRTEKALCRIFLPPQLRQHPQGRVPLLCNVGYELEPAGAKGFLAKGWAVSTPHAHPRNPLDRGPNLDVALVHAARALPFVDNERVMVQGGSAGGYMALMVAAETFPLVYALAMVPPVNWGYQAAYMFHNLQLATAVPPGGEGSAMPVLTAVLPIAEAGRKSMGPDTDADSWLMSSPISQLECYTAPMLVLWSTADLLVPIDQVGAQFVRPPAPGTFPDGFTASITALMRRPETRATLLELLPPEAYETFLVPVPPEAPILDLDPDNDRPAVPLDLPFSKERVWSIVVVDEGPMEPDVGHFRRAFAPNAEAFMAWALERGITADQVTVAKLKRLMMRLKGVEYRPFRIRLEGASEEIDAVRLDYPAAEQYDVLRGLVTFAAAPDRALRLADQYDKLPTDLKLLGASLGFSAEEVQATLLRVMDQLVR